MTSLFSTSIRNQVLSLDLSISISLSISSCPTKLVDNSLTLSDESVASLSIDELGDLYLCCFSLDSHNQASIAHSGGLGPLSKLLDSRNGYLQHNAAFSLYGLADNEATKDCVSKTLKRLEEKIHGRVLRHLLYLMRISEKSIQRRVALALAK